jgi:DNA-directed RNA polymerase subunit M/transcription elongation factor TFIIS
MKTNTPISKGIIDSWTKCPECLTEMNYLFSLNDAHEDWDANTVYQCPKCKVVITKDASYSKCLERRKSRV